MKGDSGAGLNFPQLVKRSSTREFGPILKTRLTYSNVYSWSGGNTIRVVISSDFLVTVWRMNASGQQRAGWRLELRQRSWHGYGEK